MCMEWVPLDGRGRDQSPAATPASEASSTRAMLDRVTVIFTDLPAEPSIMVESSDPMIVEASQAEGSGDVTATAGLVARGAGTATISVVDTAMPADAGGASNVIIQFTVNVSAE